MPEQLNGRIEFWNIGYPLGALVYLTGLIAFAVVVWWLYKRRRIWLLGTPNPDIGPWGVRLRAAARTIFLDGFGHRRFVRNERVPGAMHALIFWGFVILLIATTISALEFNLEKYIGIRLFTIGWSLPLELVWDLGGLAAFLGLSIALYRRYVQRPPRLNTLLDNGVLLGLLIAQVVTGFILQSLRMGATELEPASQLYNPSFAPWSPVSYVLALGIRNLGASVATMEISHFVMWWAHASLMSATFIYAAVRFSLLMHIFVAPLNILLRSSVSRPKGALRSMGNLETLDHFGANDITQLTSKQLLDFDSCTNCGRCQDQCPAWASGKPLSPRHLIQQAKAYMEARAPQLLTPGISATDSTPSLSLIDDYITPEVLWSCTTCRACMEACPVFIEHIDTIVDMRRYLTMEEAQVPATAMNAMSSMEQRGHPWRGTQATRTDWMDGTDAITMANDPEHDVLLWVGCTTALDERSQKVAKAMASVLKIAGIRYRVLGSEETCSGDPARRMGNEYLFQVLAEQNIQTLNNYGVKHVLTLCPHCFNTIKNEYPQLGGHYTVQHYTEFVAELIESKKIRPIIPVTTTLAYHDSCYLGRHNDIYDPPRTIASSIPGLQLQEMGDGRCRERGFCCGAGGGRMWMEESGQRVNHIRTDHFLETGAATVGVSCPFCLQMMEEGISAKGVSENKNAKDLLEILADSLGTNDA
jgi:Fe-S oxidoreductase/nitrate reductase gamma subunit